MVAQLFSIALEVGGSDGGALLEELRRHSETILSVASNHQLMVLGHAIVRLYQGERQAAQHCLSLVMSSKQDLADQLDRNATCVLICQAMLACHLSHAKAAELVMHTLRSHRGLHGVSAVGGAYVGPVSYWLGRLSLTVGRRNEALEYFEQAERESREARAATYVAWSSFYLARTLPASESRRCHALAAIAKKAAKEHKLYVLEAALRGNVVHSLVN